MVQSRLYGLLVFLGQIVLVTAVASGLAFWWHASHPGRISGVFDGAGIVMVVLGGFFLTTVFQSGVNKAQYDARRGVSPQMLSLPWRLTITLLLSGAFLFGIEYLLRAFSL
ncbi:hypothetical protein MF271_22690 (plasmid) [Deinococcus sp. KNUC1210]|uniref:hypothetical protein n=1 Tax=Deinococcus sp. KNUC1210 TaxID=2917691 RepID=UPI001EF13FC6|nr:hypothetical protein [Deinococcus sp. KNUC1210]ULH18274.1 hypothetical protein MF271_22690 [Deinococcus sp. KNUC1210]